MQPDTIICPHCRVGRLDLRAVNFMVFDDIAVVSAPQMPAWECDICRYREYDMRSMLRLDLLTGHSPMLDAPYHAERLITPPPMYPRPADPRFSPRGRGRRR